MTRSAARRANRNARTAVRRVPVRTVLRTLKHGDPFTTETARELVRTTARYIPFVFDGRPEINWSLCAEMFNRVAWRASS